MPVNSGLQSGGAALADTSPKRARYWKIPSASRRRRWTRLPPASCAGRRWRFPPATPDPPENGAAAAGPAPGRAGRPLSSRRPPLPPAVPCRSSCSGRIPDASGRDSRGSSFPSAGVEVTVPGVGVASVVGPNSARLGNATAPAPGREAVCAEPAAFPTAAGRRAWRRVRWSAPAARRDQADRQEKKANAGMCASWRDGMMALSPGAARERADQTA